MNSEKPISSSGGAPEAQLNPAYYIPGHARRKLLMALFGMLLMAAGISQMWLPLKLLALGERTTAEATRIIKSRPGVPELILTNDTEVHAHMESRDRSSTFWNEFHFQDTTGCDVIVRSPVGSQLKPLYELIDEDGLPTTLPIHYDRNHPETVSFPSIFSTWFAPGLLTLVGLGITVAGCILLYWANKPIEMPHLGA